MFLFGRLLPRQGDWLSIIAIGSVFVLFFFVLESHLDSFNAGLGGIANTGFDWLSFGDFTLRIGFTVDSIAVVMLGVVALVALLVQVYSVSYMRHHGRPEPRYWWYYAVMSLFAAAMLALVLADNLLLLYIAWEGGGVMWVAYHWIALERLLGKALPLWSVVVILFALVVPIVLGVLLLTGYLFVIHGLAG